MRETHCWRFACLSEIAKVYGGGTPSREDAIFWNGDIPWLTPSELTGSNRKVTTNTYDRITDSGIRSSGAVMLPVGALLVTTRATLGLRTIAGVPMTTNQGFKNLVFDRRVANPEFYYHLLGTLTREMKGRASGTTFHEISGSQFGGIQVPVPPLAEQRRIAEILDAVDEQIRAIAEIRRKLNVRLDGILSKLFVSPDEQDLSTEQLSLKDAARWLSGGTPATGVAEYWGGDIPWISAGTLKDFRVSNSDRNVTQLGVMTGSRLVPPGTTICVVRGMSLKSEFRVGVTTRQVAFGQDCKALVPVERIAPWYLGYSVRALGPRVLRLTDEAGHGTGRLETRLLENLRIRVPSISEQLQVVRIAQAGELELREYDAESAKLYTLKEALIDDVLTGRVRVPVGGGV